MFRIVVHLDLTSYACSLDETLYSDDYDPFLQIFFPLGEVDYAAAAVAGPLPF